ncbi:hypothetical protein VB715_19575 [Crocosphaera sp. UHCC 0190]|uniref:hypothetical protein n=1 Tax=Crocosphaera sp. UHCC 0190 TaxID=3110246 RepID=UPI002B216F56|nr:hypothetical protein [Crocosphaera sp. UHCC 0190]MEA5511977.1 hypothetical protein [Crocosphaera sp. UHCC 0190]
MSYYHILADLQEEIRPQQDPDLEPDFFETEIQELSERLAEVLARHHALNGQTACYSDFKLPVDVPTYKRVYKQAWDAFDPNDEF